MSIATKGLSAVGKLVSVGLLVAAFIGGLTGVVYMSLSGSEITVPEIVGKDFVQSEKELASLGLKIKKRADRASADPVNTVLEQLPKPGETVKTGQMILVVVSKSGGETDANAPATLKKDVDSDDTEKIEEMISDKPKKPKSNTNSAKKKADTLRDTNANTATSTTNSNSSSGDTDDTRSTAAPSDKNRNTNPGVKPGASPAPQRQPVTKPPSAKPPTGEPAKRPN